MTAPLEETLTALAKWGRPTLTLQDGGTWWCYIRMNTNAAGATFEVQGESAKQKTPLAAAEDCLQRVLLAVHTFEIRHSAELERENDAEKKTT